MVRIGKLSAIISAILLLSGIARAQGTASNVRHGAALPATCNASTGQVFFLTTASPAIGLYSCTATNTWTTASSTPTLNQVLSPTSSATFNVGATAPVTFTDPGSFSSAAQNTDLQSTVTGGGTCNTTSLTTPYFFTSAMVALTCDPVGSAGVTDAYSNGIWGAYVGRNTGTGGQFGWVGGVGLYGSGFAYANNEHVWGGNLSVTDQASQTGNVIIANELDTSVSNTATTGYAALASMRGNAQSTNFPAYYVQAPAGSGSYTVGFQCADGSILTAAVDCIDIGQATAGAVQTNSLALYIRSRDNGGAVTSFLQQQKGDVLMDVGVPFALYNPSTGVESYGIALTSASASIVTNMLVKVNTGAADSVIPCTTADTLCLGFVQSQEASGQYLCNNTSTDCPVATIPGSKVKGILGTGTCAIGNNVIADTTTNGRIKCQAGIPAQGAWVGIAISAQASVGSTVDIILKMQ
jgi:hypothetical protein